MTATQKKATAKAAESLEAAMAAGKESIETAVKAGTEAFKGYEDAVSYGTSVLRTTFHTRRVDGSGA